MLIVYKTSIYLIYLKQSALAFLMFLTTLFLKLVYTFLTLTDLITHVLHLPLVMKCNLTVTFHLVKYISQVNMKLIHESFAAQITY